HEGMAIIQTALPEAMAFAHNEFNNISWSTYQSIAIGPGLGASDNATQFLKAVLDNYTKPLVIDADALNILSKNKQWLNLLTANSILTPHPKEFERLFGSTQN